MLELDYVPAYGGFLITLTSSETGSVDTAAAHRNMVAGQQSTI